MGYTTQLGALGATGISAAIYNRLPKNLRANYYILQTPAAKVAPVTPIPAALVHRIPFPSVLKPASPTTITPSPSAPATPTQPLLPKTAVDVAKKVAPLVSVAGGGAITSALPLIDAASQPPTVKIRVSGDAPPMVTDTLMPNAPADGSGGASIPSSGPVMNADGSVVNDASITSTPDVVASLKSLPPLALGALVLGAAFLFSRR